MSSVYSDPEHKGNNEAVTMVTEWFPTGILRQEVQLLPNFKV